MNPPPQPALHAPPAAGSATASAPNKRYVGRFAPSPTGPLHMGSLVTALASWLDARAHGGRWLVRIEDLDRPRCMPGAVEDILRTLAGFGLQPDAVPVWQSWRTAHYAQALQSLVENRHAYPCACTRKEISDSLRHVRERHQTLAYPGTCRPENGGLGQRAPRAWRVRVPDQGPADAPEVSFIDRWQGQCTQNLAIEVGDFVVRRADGEWAYQLAVVVDDALQGITDVVRGADLLDSTARQVWLQHLLGVPTPRYMHVPVVTNAQGEKLSKQTGAARVDAGMRMESLREAGAHLGLVLEQRTTTADWLSGAVAAWRARLSLS